ncbi:hypothetical protein B2G71_14235 [Novosphingobium sp. PC22D]|uniref:PepSY-associated TM helix domain-containing protein n=1 Tax=Novosphingobium sp. PC22D TaxID=1962403 RepID=UPI000BFAEB4F|nr:PepSY-associated TM helix domain-containing protein [Novosphingobium sp. PC22D]PEQ11938.1 hypothetical protein B2G71_14235 [Novosphingobium sp. PC22D]
MATLHRQLGLAAGVLWLFQATTGTLIVFHWELSDLSASAAHRPTDLGAIGQRIAAVNSDGSGRRVTALWTSDGLADRFDMFISGSATRAGETIRIAGDGAPLRVRPEGARGVTGTLVSLHHDLLVPPFGRWLLGVSGLLLLSNLAVGLAMALPRTGTWRKALVPRKAGPLPTRLYGWHRAIGLIAALPALLTVGSGVLLAFNKPIESLAGIDDPALASPTVPHGGDIGLAEAVHRALAEIPGSTLTAVKLPTETDRTYAVRLKEPGELARAYGASMVFVDAGTGTVRGRFPASEMSGPQALMAALFPLHSGGAGGTAGRVLVLAVGLWLATMTVTGWLLWRARKVRRP